MGDLTGILVNATLTPEGQKALLQVCTIVFAECIAVPVTLQMCSRVRGKFILSLMVTVRNVSPIILSEVAPCAVR